MTRRSLVAATGEVMSFPSPIRSLNHPLIRRVRALHQRAERERSGCFYVEGMRFVARALDAHRHSDQTPSGAIKVEVVLYCPPLLTHTFGRDLVRRAQAEGVPCQAVRPEVLRGMTQVEDAQGIGAIVRRSCADIESLPVTGVDCWVAVQEVQSPGNLGTIFRSGEAAGERGVIVIGEAVDPFDPTCVRASMASHFSQQIVRASLPDFLGWKERHKVLLVGTSPRGRHLYVALDYRAPLVLWMGGERPGLSADALAVCDQTARIPMHGRCNSLNLAMATTLMLFEVGRQRRHGAPAARSPR